MNQTDSCPDGIRTRADLEKLQLEKLRGAVDRALKTPFYRDALAERGIRSGSDMRSLSDLSALPFTTKHDLRKAYPYGLVAAPLRDLVRMHASSGTTGSPTVIHYTQADIDRWAELGVRSIRITGCTEDDVFQNMMSYGLFTGGLGLHYAAERAGLMVIPSGGGNTERQLKLMQDFGTTVVHATPSYLLHVHEHLEQHGIRRENLKLRKAFIGAEPHSEDTRRKLEELWGIDAYNSYGMSEMNGPCVAFECACKNGMHIWEDAYIIEIIDPDTLEVLPEGSEGELVLTILDREGTQILRYRSRDLTKIISEPCDCGCIHRRIQRIRGRSDDMLIINGVNIFPSQVEEVIMKCDGLGTNWRIQVDKDGALDRMTVEVELGSGSFSDDLRDIETLRRRIAGHLAASITIHPRILVHEPGLIPRSEGKAVRVLDNRPK